MKLYYSKGVCSLAPHIILEEIGSPYETVEMIAERGDFEKPEFLTKNPLGYVPLLVLDGGKILTEGVAIQTYLADAFPEAKLAPPAGTFERAKLMQWLTFISTELHKSFGPIFNPTGFHKDPAQSEAIIATAREVLTQKFTWLDGEIGGRPYLLGDSFSIADAYLFTVTNWMRPAGLKREAWPNIAAHSARMIERPAVRRVMEAEGLI